MDWTVDRTIVYAVHRVGGSKECCILECCICLHTDSAVFASQQCCICPTTVLTVGGFSFRLLISFEKKTADTETDNRKSMAPHHTYMRKSSEMGLAKRFAVVTAAAAPQRYS